MLANNPDVATVGMEIRQNVMTFAELLNWMYRDKSVGDQHGVPTYGMYNLATNFTPTYDMSYSWTLIPNWLKRATTSTSCSTRIWTRSPWTWSMVLMPVTRKVS